MDAVITYVDCTKHDWIYAYKANVKKPISEERFRSWGTLEWQVQGIIQHMPFIKHIYIVVSNYEQVNGLNFPSNVKIVEHVDIIPKEYLPTFNSCTIEMFLGFIPDLSNEFIYFNDDMFVVKDMVETDFFEHNKPCLNPDIEIFSFLDQNSLYRSNCIKSTACLTGIGNLSKNQFFIQQHCARPMTVSSYKNVWDVYKANIIVSLSRTRNAKNCNAYLFNNYDILTNNYVKGSTKYKFFQLNEQTIDEILQFIKNPIEPMICLNDNCNDKNYKLVKEKLVNVLPKKYENTIQIIPQIIETKQNNKKQSLTAALCAIAKNENLYIREWVEWYKNLGIDKIFLYDNNDIDGEHFEDVINDFIESGFVEIIDVRGEVSYQTTAYTECYNKYGKNYEWMCFFDIDEFLSIDKKYNNSIINFISEFIDLPFNCIKICWKQFTDNNLIKVVNNNYSINRFKDFLPLNTKYASDQTKSIIKTNIENLIIDSPHGALQSQEIISCNSVGNNVKNTLIMNNPVWDNACLNHYRCKTIEEYVTNKITRGWPTLYGNCGNDKLNLDFFFRFNTYSDEKYKFASKLIENIKHNFIFINCWCELCNETSIKHINLGDDLNFTFLPKIINAKFIPYRNRGKLLNDSYKNNINYVFIGSILSDVFINKNSIIWGSGIISDNTIIDKNTFTDKIYAVRGPLTRKKLIDCGINCPEIYGDPALLLPLYYKPEIKKTHKIGIILHWRTSKLNIENKDVKIINIKNYNKFTDIIDDILSCENIVSESLHGLIIAEAYHIPNLWVDVSLEKVEHSEFKFHDFFSSLDADREKPFKLTSSTSVYTLLNELKKYKQGKMVDLNKLIAACPLKINL